MSVHTVVRPVGRVVKRLFQLGSSNPHDRRPLNRHPQKVRIVFDDGRHRTRGKTTRGVQGRKPAIGKPRQSLDSSQPDHTVPVLIDRPVNTSLEAVFRPVEPGFAIRAHDADPAVRKREPDPVASIGIAHGDADGPQVGRQDQGLELPAVQ